MLTVSYPEVWGFEHAFRGMRNPLKSHDKSTENADLILAKKLISAGPEHRKFLRQIFISMDIRAPRYWWMQFDTYKIATTSNSESTMHTIMKEPFDLSDFSLNDDAFTSIIFMDILSTLNKIRMDWCRTKCKKDWELLIQILPQSYLQTRTVTFTYETALNIIKQRRGHKVKEWDIFISHLFKLPHMSEFYTAMEG